MAKEIQVQGRTPEEIKAYELKKKAEAERKKKEKPKTPEKKYYTINVEALVPCTITYRVYAEDENKALELCDKTNHQNIKHLLHKKIKTKATVYEAGRSLIKLIKNFRV